MTKRKTIVAGRLPASHVGERTTTSGTVLALLRRNEGATIPELIQATSWLPHTTRAALTGLRKKGYAIERTTRDDVSYYRIAAST